MLWVFQFSCRNVSQFQIQSSYSQYQIISTQQNHLTSAVSISISQQHIFDQSRPHLQVDFSHWSSFSNILPIWAPIIDPISSPYFYQSDPFGRLVCVLKSIWYHDNAVYLEQFINLRQGKLTVDEYSDEFSRLQELCGLNESEIHDLNSFIRGLTPDILEYERLQDHLWSILGSSSC